MLNNIKNAKKKAWIIIGVSFAMILGCAAVVWTDHGTITEEEGKITGLESQIMQADGRIRKIKPLEDRVLHERLVVKEYAKILPDDKEIHDFVDRITEYAAASGVEIEALDDRSARNRNARATKDAIIKIKYKIDIRGTVDEFLEFTHHFETYDRFINVKSFKITGNKDDSKDEEGQVPRHKITMDLETYVYQPGNQASPPVEIVNADKRIYEILQTNPLTDRLELETFDYIPNTSRRDPFADPRILVGADVLVADRGQEDVAMQLEKIEKLKGEFADLQTQVSKEENIQEFVQRIEFTKRLNHAMVEFGQKVKNLRKEKYFNKTATRDSFEADVAGPFEVLFKTRADDDRGNLAYQELESEFERMKVAFKEGRFPDVMASNRAIAGSKSATHPDPRILEIMTRIDKLSTRAANRVEFAQMPLTIRGYVIQPNRPEKAVVIINDRAYSPGDVLDDGVVVGKVDRSTVVFLFKREEIERPLE